MQLSIHANHIEMSAEAARAVIRLSEEFTRPLVCFPSGKTPVLFCQQIVEHFRKIDQVPDWYFVGLDEWIGVSDQQEGGCRHFFNEHLFRPLQIPEENISFFDGSAADPEKERSKAERFIADHGGIDICVLGLGMNGHLGLNEPGSDPEARTLITALTAETRNSARAYFQEGTNLPERGITLGLRTILDAGTVFLLASGSHKASIVDQVLKGPVDPMLPATLLKEHPDCWVYLDREAAGDHA